jgi:hypothetical protein
MHFWGTGDVPLSTGPPQTNGIFTIQKDAAYVNILISLVLRPTKIPRRVVKNASFVLFGVLEK